jgi:hypothetical protein
MRTRTDLTALLMLLLTSPLSFQSALFKQRRMKHLDDLSRTNNKFFHKTREILLEQSEFDIDNKFLTIKNRQQQTKARAEETTGAKP